MNINYKFEGFIGIFDNAVDDFTHTHRGNPPLTADKYIITTWVEFIE